MSMPVARSLFFSGLAMALASSSLQGQEGRHNVRSEAGTTNRDHDRSSSMRSTPSLAGGSGSPRTVEHRLADSLDRNTNPGKRGGAQDRPMPIPVVPSFSPRCTVQPTPTYWQHRDLFKEIQSAARRGGYLPVTEVAETLAEIQGVASFPAGWKAYGFLIPPSGKLHVRLHHPNEGWFRVTMSNKSGSLERGMLQNLVPTGNPEATYLNPSTSEAKAVYVIVDDPGWMSSEAKPYKIAIDRSWQPGSFEFKANPKVQGIWAAKTDEGQGQVKARVESSRLSLAQ